MWEFKTTLVSAEAFGVCSSRHGAALHFPVRGCQAARALPCGRMLWLDGAAAPGQPSLPAGPGAAGGETWGSGRGGPGAAGGGPGAAGPGMELLETLRSGMECLDQAWPGLGRSWQGLCLPAVCRGTGQGALGRKQPPFVVLHLLCQPCRAYGGLYQRCGLCPIEEQQEGWGLYPGMDLGYSLTGNVHLVSQSTCPLD